MVTDRERREKEGEYVKGKRQTGKESGEQGKAREDEEREGKGEGGAKGRIVVSLYKHNGEEKKR